MKKPLVFSIAAGIFAMAFTVSPVGAQTVSELEAQLNALRQQAQILQQLQSAPSTVTSAPQPTGGACITTNLRRGSRGPQVSVLQQALGMNLAQDQYGYFGPQTEAAVIAFQNQYSSEVLAPVGLKQGNGFVGSGTRAALNRLRGCVVSDQSFAPPQSPSISSSSQPILAPITASTSSPTITSLSPTSGIPGMIVRVEGTNFNATNTVYFGRFKVSSTLISFQDTPKKFSTQKLFNSFLRRIGVFFTASAQYFTQALQFAVPNTGAGIYNVAIENKSGISNVKSFKVLGLPVISQVQPIFGPGWTVVTISASNLDSSSVVNFGTINVSGTLVNNSTGLSFSVPRVSSGFHLVSVTNSVGKSNNAYFTVTGPTIRSISPTSGPSGTVVMIRGTNFVFSPQLENLITFKNTINGVTSAFYATATSTMWSITPAHPATSTPTLILTVPPNMAAAPYTVSIQNRYGKSADVNFTVTAPTSLKDNGSFDASGAVAIPYTGSLEELVSGDSSALQSQTAEILRQLQMLSDMLRSLQSP